MLRLIIAPHAARAMDPHPWETARLPSSSNARALIVQAPALGSVHRLEAVEYHAAVRVIR